MEIIHFKHNVRQFSELFYFPKNILNTFLYDFLKVFTTYTSTWLFGLCKQAVFMMIVFCAQCPVHHMLSVTLPSESRMKLNCLLDIFGQIFDIHPVLPPCYFTSGSTSSSRRTGASSESPRPTSVERPGAVHPWVSAHLRNNPSSVSPAIPGSSSTQVQPSHPFIQDPAMPPNPAPNPLTQLEEARRRLEEERRRNALQQAKQRWASNQFNMYHPTTSEGFNSCLCFHDIPIWVSWHDSCSLSGISLVSGRCVRIWRWLTTFVESRSHTEHPSKAVWWLWASSKSCLPKRAITGENIWCIIQR